MRFVRAICVPDAHNRISDILPIQVFHCTVAPSSVVPNTVALIDEPARNASGEPALGYYLCASFAQVEEIFGRRRKWDLNVLASGRVYDFYEETTYDFSVSASIPFDVGFSDERFLPHGNPPRLTYSIPVSPSVSFGASVGFAGYPKSLTHQYFDATNVTAGYLGPRLIPFTIPRVAYWHAADVFYLQPNISYSLAYTRPIQDGAYGGGPYFPGYSVSGPTAFSDSTSLRVDPFIVPTAALNETPINDPDGNIWFKIGASVGCIAPPTDGFFPYRDAQGIAAWNPNTGAQLLFPLPMNA